MRQISVPSGVPVYRLGQGNILRRTHQTISGEELVTVGNKLRFYVGAEYLPALPLEGESSLYILERDLHENHDPRPAS